MNPHTATAARMRLSPLLKQSSGVFAVRGEGAYLFDDQGSTYLDFTSSIGVTATGHCHPTVVEAARKQAAELIHGQYTTVMHPKLLELTEPLGSVMPEHIDTMFYASAGAESVEAAVRLCKQATGRQKIIVFQGSFHGRTTAAAAMTTSGTKIRAGLEPLISGVVVAPYPDPYRYGWDEDATTQFCLDEFDRILATLSAPEETAAVFIEPVQGDGGYTPREHHIHERTTRTVRQTRDHFCRG